MKKDKIPHTLREKTTEKNFIIVTVPEMPFFPFYMFLYVFYMPVSGLTCGELCVCWQVYGGIVIMIKCFTVFCFPFLTQTNLLNHLSGKKGETTKEKVFIFPSLSLVQTHISTNYFSSHIVNSESHLIPPNAEHFFLLLG